MFGMFESETVVSVSTSVSRVIEDRLIPNSIKTGTIKGILTGDQLVENIMEDVIASMGVKGERLYRYGKTAYPYGVPTSRVHKSTSVDAITKAVLANLVGAPVTPEYVRYGPLNRQHYGWQVLCDTYGYVPLTNELTVLSAAKGAPVYLEDMQVVVSQEKISTLSGTAFAQWGTAANSGYTPLRPYSTGTGYAHTPIGVDAVATGDYLKVTCIWRTVEGIQREVFTFPMLVSDSPTDHIQIKYSYQVEVSRTSNWEMGEVGPYKEIVTYAKHIKYFTYQIGEGAYPELDALFTTEYDDTGSFFPFAYFRFNRTATSTDPRSTEYKALSKFMKYLNMDYEQINEAINANPQIDKVESALLMMLVPAVSGDPMENRYLFDFFRGLYAQSGAVIIPLDGPLPLSYASSKLYDLMSRGSKAPGRISMIIRDARFSTSLNMAGIFRKIVPGVIGKVGTYTSGEDTLVRQHSGVQMTGEFNEYGYEKTSTYTWQTTEPYHFYRKQISSHLYEEIQVYNLRMTYEVWGGHATTNYMVPIDHAITEQYSLPDRERLYARSLHYVFNSKQETEVEWYQQEWFGIVLIVVAVVWTIFSMGSDGGSGLAAAIAAGTATLEMVLIAVLIMAAEYLAITLVAKLFVKLLGPEFAMALAVVAAAYGMYSGYGATAGSMDSMLAQNLLSVSNSMISEVSAGYKKDLELLKKEGEEFNLFAQAKMDELEKVREEMEGSRILSPFILFGESPTNYFNRTVHAGNIGIHGLDAIENYCSMALRLPELEQTIDFGHA